MFCEITESYITGFALHLVEISMPRYRKLIGSARLPVNSRIIDSFRDGEIKDALPLKKGFPGS
jgi:hypothetical protein